VADRRGRRWSRAGVAAIAAGATFVVAGFFSGRLLDEHGGALGALEWLLRTLVVLSAIVFIVAAVVLVARVRRLVRWRPLGWLLAAAAFAAFAWYVAIPLAFGVYLTHLPARDPVGDSDLGAPKREVELTGADGLRLRGWYVPSRNRAALIAMHGTGGSRVGVEREARVLVRHGYGVLALDLRGHGESEGRSTSLPWKLDDDVDAALDWLAARRDVDPRRIGLLGVSLGAEVALRVAPRRRDVRAIVAEGLMGGTSDAREAGVSLPALAQIAALSAVSDLLGGQRAGAGDAELVERLSPRPLLLISAGRSTEADVNADLLRRAGPSAQRWHLPDAPHGGAIEADPRGYERRVIAFLDDALGG
jgi:alpha/beta superfamily hydrolase